MDLNLDGKVALVCASSKGIGKGIGVAATAAAISVVQVCRGIYKTKETLVNSQKAYMIPKKESGF